MAVQLESQSKYDENMLKRIDGSLNKRRREAQAATFDTGYTPGQGAPTRMKAAFRQAVGEGVERTKKGVDTTSDIASDIFTEFRGERKSQQADEEFKRQGDLFRAGEITEEEYKKAQKQFQYSEQEAQVFKKDITSGMGVGAATIGLETTYAGVGDTVFGSMLSLFNPNSSLGMSKIDNDPFHRTAFEKTATSVFNGLADINKGILDPVEQETARDPVKGAEFIEQNKMEGVDVMLDIATAGAFKFGGYAAKKAAGKGVGIVTEPLSKLKELTPAAKNKKAIRQSVADKFVENVATKESNVSGSALKAAPKAKSKKQILKETAPKSKTAEAVKMKEGTARISPREWREQAKIRKLTSTQTIDELSNQLPAEQFLDVTEKSLTKMPEGTAKDMFKNSLQEVMHSNPAKFMPNIGRVINNSKDFVLKELDKITNTLKEGPVKINGKSLQQIQRMTGMADEDFKRVMEVVTEKGRLTADGIKVLQNKANTLLSENISKLAGNTDKVMQNAIKSDPLGFLSNRKMFKGMSVDSVQKDLLGFFSGKRSDLSRAMSRLGKTREVYNPVTHKMSELAAVVPEIYDIMKKGFKEKRPSADIMADVRQYATKHINENPQAQEFISKAEKALGMTKEASARGTVMMGDVWEGTKKYMDTAKKHLSKLKQYGMDASIYQKTHDWLNNKASGKHFADEKPVVNGVVDEVNEGIVNDFVVEARQKGSNILEETINNTVAAIDVIKKETKDFIENPSVNKLIVDSEEATKRQVAASLGESIAKKLQDKADEFEQAVVMDSLNKSMDVVDTAMAGRTVEDLLDEKGMLKSRAEKALKKSGPPTAEEMSAAKKQRIESIDKKLAEGGKDDVVESFVRETDTGLRNLADEISDLERTEAAMNPKDRIEGIIEETGFVANNKYTKEALEKQVQILDNDIPRLEKEFEELKSDGFNAKDQISRERIKAELAQKYRDIKNSEIDAHENSYGKSALITDIKKSLTSLDDVNLDVWESAEKQLKSAKSPKEVQKVFNNAKEKQLQKQSEALLEVNKSTQLDLSDVKKAQAEVKKNKKPKMDKEQFKKYKASEREFGKIVNSKLKEAKQVLKKDLNNAMAKNVEDFFKDNQSSQKVLKDNILDVSADMLLMDDLVTDVTSRIGDLNKKEAIKEASERFLPTFQKLFNIDRSSKYLSNKSKKELSEQGVSIKSFGKAFNKRKLATETLNKFANELSKNSELSYKELKKGMLKELLNNM